MNRNLKQNRKIATKSIFISILLLISTYPTLLHHLKLKHNWSSNFIKQSQSYIKNKRTCKTLPPWPVCLLHYRWLGLFFDCYTGFKNEQERKDKQSGFIYYYYFSNKDEHLQFYVCLILVSCFAAIHTLCFSMLCSIRLWQVPILKVT